MVSCLFHCYSCNIELGSEDLKEQHAYSFQSLQVSFDSWYLNWMNISKFTVKWYCISFICLFIGTLWKLFFRSILGAQRSLQPHFSLIRQWQTLDTWSFGMAQAQVPDLRYADSRLPKWFSNRHDFEQFHERVLSFSVSWWIIGRHN